MYNKIIEEILKVYNINASELAEKIGVQRSGISHILSGRNKPSIDFLIKIKEQFPDIQWEYLMTGKGSMFVTNVNNSKKVNEVNLQAELFPENEENKKPHAVKKIVWFYENGTFKIFTPED